MNAFPCTRGGKRGWLDYRLTSQEFILRTHQAPEAQVAEISELLWQFFAGVQPMLEAINQEMREFIDHRSGKL